MTAEATTPPGLDFAVERPTLRRLERWLGLAVAVPAGIAVLLEVGILLYSVTMRFVFNNPLVWGDELASMVFLWLAMLGSVLALWNGEHMRLTTIASRLPARWRALSDTLAVAAPCLFLAMVIGPTLDFMEDQSFVETPALGWPDSVRAAAVPVGCALMLLLCVLRLLQHRLRDVLACVAVLGVIAAGLWLTAGPIVAMGNLNLLVFFVLLLGAGVLIGVPIAFAFGLATVATLLTTTSTPLAVLPGRIDEGMSSLILLAVPLFIMLGRLIEITEMAKAMVAFLAALLGHVRGGLHYVLLGAMLLVSGISGAKTADMAAVAPVLFPEMRKRGLNDGEMVSLLAGAGAMAETIPPSGTDCDRLRHRRVDSGAIHGRAAARCRAGDRPRHPRAAAHGNRGHARRQARLRRDSAAHLRGRHPSAHPPRPDPDGGG